MLSVNGIQYRTPIQPTVVVCMDGISPLYLEQAIQADKAPTFKRFKKGFYAVADDVIPSFTNPNNISIVTGALPEVHGITTSGHSYNRESKKHETIYHPEDIRCDSILKAFSDNGIKVASITTKDKLRFLPQ